MVLKSARWLLMWSNALRFRVNPWVFSARFVPSILADLLGVKSGLTTRVCAPNSPHNAIEKKQIKLHELIDVACSKVTLNVSERSGGHALDAKFGFAVGR